MRALKVAKGSCDIESLKELSLAGKLQEAEKLLDELELYCIFPTLTIVVRQLWNYTLVRVGLKRWIGQNMLYRMYTLFDKKGWVHE